MDQETMLRFTLILEAERQKILDQSKNTIEEFVNHHNEIGDEGDEAQQLIETDLSLRFRDRERQLLAKINYALRRIKEGTFGQCETCEEEIGIKRLESRPIATLCIKCKEAEERLEKTFNN